MKSKFRPFAVPAAMLALLLASGCVTAPKETETAQAEAEADAATSASTDADSGATASY